MKSIIITCIALAPFLSETITPSHSVNIENYPAGYFQDSVKKQPVPTKNATMKKSSTKAKSALPSENEKARVDPIGGEGDKVYPKPKMVPPPKPVSSERPTTNESAKPNPIGGEGDKVYPAKPKTATPAKPSTDTSKSPVKPQKN